MSRNITFKIGSFDLKINVSNREGFAEASLLKDRYLAEAEANKQQTLANYTSLSPFI